MIPDLYIPSYTINEWAKWEGDWELIKGHPVSMSPSPVTKHQLMGGDIFTYLNIELKKNRTSCNCHVLYEEDWIVDNTTVVRPDIMIACGDLDPNGHITKAPALIVEIFSPSTQLKDRNTKFSLYEFCGVKYYLMADPDNTEIQIFNLVDNKYKQVQHPATLQITDSCNISFDVNAIFES